MKLDVAVGGERSKSGVYQGDQVEGFPWGGDFDSLTNVRKYILPGDLMDIYVYEPTGGRLDYTLAGNIFIRIPYPEMRIQGECGWW